MPKERRRRGDGSAPRLRSDGRWEARISLGFRDGKRVQRFVYGRTAKEAERERDNALRRIRSGLEPVDPHLTLDAYLEGWLADVKPTIAPSTHRSYSDHVKNHVGPLLGGIPVLRLRPPDVRRLIADRLAAGKSPATVRLIVTTLRMALQAGVADRLLAENPAAGLRLPRVEREPVRALSEAETRRLLRIFEADPLGPLYTLLLGSGLRLGEALALDWQDVNLERRYVQVRTSKTAKGIRAVPIPVFVVTALRAHKPADAKPTDPVFLGPRSGERLKGWTPTHHLPRLLIAHGERRMHPHDLRHGTATRMAMAGVPMRLIAEQLGHANPSLTARVYSHVVPEALMTAIDSTDVAIESQDDRQTS